MVLEVHPKKAYILYPGGRYPLTGPHEYIAEARGLAIYVADGPRIYVADSLRELALHILHSLEERLTRLNKTAAENLERLAQTQGDAYTRACLKTITQRRDEAERIREAIKALENGTARIILDNSPLPPG